MPSHGVNAGERLVGGNAHYESVATYNGQSGTVEFCSPATESGADPLAAWDAFFGSPIEAGARMPRGEPSPDDLAAIDDAEAAWSTAAGDSYCYLVSVSDRNTRPVAAPRPGGWS